MFKSTEKLKKSSDISTEKHSGALSKLFQGNFSINLASNLTFNYTQKNPLNPIPIKTSQKHTRELIKTLNMTQGCSDQL